MAKLTYSRARKPLVDDAEINLSAEGFNSGRWDRLGLSIIVKNESGDYYASYNLRFSRIEAARIAVAFREYLDAEIDNFGRPINKT